MCGPVSTSSQFSRLDLMTSLALLVGLWQSGFALLGLGRLSWVLSEVLVSGYTCAAAIHVLASQLKGIFGISLASHPGPLKLAKVLMNLFYSTSVILLLSGFSGVHRALSTHKRSQLGVLLHLRRLRRCLGAQ